MADNVNTPLISTDGGGGNGGGGEDDEKLINVAVELPACAFRINSLVSLKLHRGSPTTSADFTTLHSLLLHHILFMNSDSLRNFISKCPRLVYLHLEECVFSDFKIIDISSTALEKLHLISRSPTNESLSKCEIKVACPSLEALKFGIAKSAADFTFQETNRLRTADIFLIEPPAGVPATAEQYRFVLSKIINGLCNVQVLRLTMPFKNFPFPNAVPDHFSNSFNNLKRLFVYVGINNWFMEAMINLLSCSPILEFLEVDFYKHPNVWIRQYKCRSTRWIIPTDSSISCLTNHVKIVEIKGFENIEKEIEFVRFVIKHGKKLQEMRITWMHDDEISHEIEQYIKELPAASSSSATVTFNYGR